MSGNTPAAFTIPLADDFREPPRTSIGFQGRKSEVDHLRHLLENRRSGSVLVSGPRGVGKTAFVQHALASAKPSPDVVVNLNLPLALSEGGPEVRRRVLLSMIRGLAYAVPRTKKLQQVRKALATAREKSELSDLEEHEVVGALVQSRDAFANERRTDVQISPAKSLVTLGGALLAAGTSLIAVIAYLLALPDLGAGWSLLPAALVTVIALASGIAVKRSTSSNEHSEESTEQRAQVERVGRYDLSDDAIEAELVQVLKKAEAKRVRPIFILDELDKVTAEEEGEIINSLLFSLKNLFTLENALFVFITSEGYYRRHWSQLRDSPYAEVHTVFTDRLFVPMLYYQDAELLIDNLLGRANGQSGTPEYKVLRNYLTWISECHPYDLISHFNELVSYEAGKPRFQAIESGVVGHSWQQGNLPSDWRRLAALQKFVGATFDEFRRRGFASAVFNHSLWLALSQAAHHLGRESRISYDEEKGVPIPEELVVGLTMDEHKDLQGAIQHMLALMERFGQCSYSSGTPDESEGDEAATHTYELNSHANYPPPEIAHTTARTPEEDALVQLAGVAETVAGNIEAAGGDLSTYTADLEDLRGAKKVVEAPGRGGKLPRHVLLEKFRAGDEILEELSEVAIGARVANWASGHELVVGENDGIDDPRTNRPLRESLQEYAGFLEALNEAHAEYRVLASKTNENRAIVVINVENQSLDAVAKAYSQAKPGAKGGDERKVRLPIIEVRRATPGSEIEYPKEIVSIIEENDRKSWMWSWLNPFDPGEEERDVAGWHVFELSDSCDNIANLDNLLESETYIVALDEPVP